MAPPAAIESASPRATLRENPDLIGQQIGKKIYVTIIELTNKMFMNSGSQNYKKYQNKDYIFKKDKINLR